MAFLRKLENMGVLDFVVWSGIIAVAVITAIGLSVPVILEQPQWWGYQPAIGAEVFAQIENQQMAEPYCLGGRVVDWDGIYYVAYPPDMHLSEKEVEVWYYPFFLKELGYIPKDIRPLAGVDGSTDSIGSHYINAWYGQIYIDNIPCK